MYSLLHCVCDAVSDWLETVVTTHRIIIFKKLYIYMMVAPGIFIWGIALTKSLYDIDNQSCEACVTGNTMIGFP